MGQDLLGIERADGKTARRDGRQKAFGGDAGQRFAHWCARDAQLAGQLDFIDALARAQAKCGRHGLDAFVDGGGSCTHIQRCIGSLCTRRAHSG